MPEKVHAVAYAVVVLLAVLVQRSFAGFLLAGFGVWIHEFGHATAAWMTGHRALPLPIGWTNIAPEKSLFVYCGVLFLLALFVVAGWREDKALPVFAGIVLAAVQALMTWVLPENTAKLWISFAGPGGEFYLAALMMGLFWFDLPAKFKWGMCRYVFLFIGTASFSRSYSLWYGVRHGTESVPYGTMVYGEDDAGGDLDTLRYDFGWSEPQIVSTYYHVANVCLIAIVVLYVTGALGLHRRAMRWATRA